MRYAGAWSDRAEPPRPAGIGWGILAFSTCRSSSGPRPRAPELARIILLGALVALDLEAFRRVAIGELGTGDAAPPSAPPPSAPAAPAA
jgi:hypothetical protein